MSLPSRAAGVGHPVEPAALVVRSNGISSQHGRRAGVTVALKVQRCAIPPSPLNAACNLFAKDCWRAQLSDEGSKGRPNVSFIARALRAAMTDASDAVGLAGDAAGPRRALVRPSGDPERSGPSADAGEEMALPVSSEVVGVNKSNVPFIDIARRYVPRRDEIAEPLRGVGVDFVVVRTGH